ncbi:cytochrome P450 [Mycena crocata]|nr:cytochrome P450 [Mycena crocata]
MHHFLDPLMSWTLARDLWSYQGAAILSLFTAVYTYSTVRVRKTQYLPGPPGWPIIGNLFDLNVEHLYVKCREWAEIYGDVYSLNMLGETMVIVNSATAASELLDQRGTKYSGRPYMPMLTELMGWEWSISFLPYGNRWREMRRLFHNHYGSGMTDHRFPALQEAQKLVMSLFNNPDDFSRHLKMYTAGVIIKRTYGYDIKTWDDPLLYLVDETSKTTSLAVTPGKYWVNLFPKMKYIPEWTIPGGGFKKQARVWRKLTEAMVEQPFQMVKKQVSEGHATPCFVSTCLESDLDMDTTSLPLGDKIIKETAAVAYAGGVDTTFSALASCVLFMTLNPDVQRRVQAEIDEVCSPDRLPLFSDRPQMPFTETVLVEVLRLIPPLPLAVPHRLDEDDIYRGKLVPRGSLVLANIWAILHDEQVFSDASRFNPDRYADNPALMDAALSAIFGYGRRACAGKSVALDTVWIAVVTMLATFDISKAVDADGNEVDVEVKVLPGMASHSHPFACKFAPRSSASAALIEGLSHDLREA